MLSINGSMTPEDLDRLKRIRTAWNFYDGFHWEDIEAQDTPEVTQNYCRAYVNKFVSFEFGAGFKFKTHAQLEDKKVNEEGETLFEFLERVWDDNSKMLFSVELGQSKAITGDGWVQVSYTAPEDLDDPYEEYPEGRIQVLVIPTAIVFPIYDQYDKSKLEQVTIQYPIERREETPILRRSQINKIVYKQIWTKDTIRIYEGNKIIADQENPYGIIPFIQIKNYVTAGRGEGTGDLEDLVPLNTELNLKNSDISEIIDYHSAPITIVFGAKVGSLEKGANKIWGGLPKDSRVENLHLQGELEASVNYVKEIKESMSEIGGVPDGSLGGKQHISNTSGVALEYANLPLIERTRIKRLCSEEGLKKLNKLILLVAKYHELISIPEGIKPSVFYYNKVTLPSTLPKDKLIELQAIEQEMRLGIEDRRGAMDRLGKDNVEKRIKEIDTDRKSNPEIYSIEENKINSGMTNGRTSIETLRKETKGENTR